MNILVSGATGLVGSALCSHLLAAGHTVRKLSRAAPRPGDNAFRWDPARGEIDSQAFNGVDAVIHLAGENIAGRRWSEEVKAAIRDSRIQGTRLLSEALVRQAKPPHTFLSASAIGYYGDRGDELLTEQSPPGRGFLSEVCIEWERAADPARRPGIRVVHLRIGVVLSPRGGALAKMLTPFKLGLGGRVGSGRQFWSWIALDDCVAAMRHVLETDALQGPVNLTAPHPVTNREFTKALGQVLRRPTIFPMPAFAARLALGRMADALLLASTRVRPEKLLASGYSFRHPVLEEALRTLLS